jgi:hypothetical protein
MRRLFCNHAGTLDLTAGLALIALFGFCLTLLGASTKVAIAICMFPIAFIVFYDGPVLFSRINRRLVLIGDRIEVHAKSDKGGFTALQGVVLGKGECCVPASYADEYLDAEKAEDFCVELDTGDGQRTVPFRYLVRLL